MSYHTVSMDASGPEWLYIPDVEYKQYGDISRKLQMIVPFGTDQKYPLVVYLPGSAFYRQEMYLGVPQYAKLAQQGYVVAALQYRESQIAKFPAQVQDVHNAITFLKTKAEEFHIDTGRIFLMGHSSGGYNAAMAGLTAGLEEFDGGVGHDIRGVITLAAPLCLKFEMGMTVPGKVSYDPNDYRPELDMLGLERFEDDPELCLRARPDSYIYRTRVPFLLLHGNRDQVVYMQNSRDFYESLRDAGKQAEFYEIKDQDHGGPWMWDGQTLELMVRFMKEAEA